MFNKESNKELVQALLKLGYQPTNVVDMRALNLWTHVIYKGIEDPSIKVELNQACIKILDDCKLLGIGLPDILIECINGGRYKRMMPPILNQYWNHFIESIEYLVNPSPEMEGHILAHYIERAEFNARQLVEAEFPELNNFRFNS